MLNEKKLILGCRKNNRTAQKMVYEKYAPHMKAVCLRYVRDTAEVKDIVQEGFIKVFMKIKQYKGKGSFEGWIRRIIVNTAISHIRKQKKHYDHYDIDEIRETNINGSYRENDSLNTEGTEIDKQDIDEEKINFSLIETADFSREELLEVLKILPEGFRIVFNLFTMDGYKHEEIAKMLKIEVKTSRSRLSRARKMLQQELYKQSIAKLGK